LVQKHRNALITTSIRIPRSLGIPNAPVFCQIRFSNLHCYFSILLFCQIHFSCLPTPFCQIVASNCYFLILLFWEVYFSCLPTLFCQILNSTFLFSYFANFCQVHFSCLSTPFCQIVNSTLLFPYFVILLSFLFCQIHFSYLPTPFCQIIKSTLLFPYFVILSSLLFGQVHFSHLWIFATWTNLFQEMTMKFLWFLGIFFASFFEIQIIKLATSGLTHSTYLFKLSKFTIWLWKNYFIFQNPFRL
jgi:hypothetical protein